MEDSHARNPTPWPADKPSPSSDRLVDLIVS